MTDDSQLSERTWVKDWLAKDALLCDEADFIKTIEELCGKKLGLVLTYTEEDLRNELKGQAGGMVNQLMNALKTAASDLGKMWPPRT